MNKNLGIVLTFAAISFACIFEPLASIGFIFAMIIWGLNE